MRVDAARFVPVLILFADDASRAETWGRLLSLSPEGARLICRAPISDGSLLLLEFEVFGDAFKGIEAAVTGVSIDPDGYSVAVLNFKKTTDRLVIGRAVRRVVASDLPDTR
ncbi:MAG: hypothetical protein COB53_02175 [Elusimicrobia bacterium]|nr:MAG: hypothetical protein COB53_02175 [Elusimicrobiota bacterium]